MNEKEAAACAKKIIAQEKVLNLNTISENPLRPFSLLVHFLQLNDSYVPDINGSLIISMFTKAPPYINFKANGLISVTFVDSSLPQPVLGPRFTCYGIAKEIPKSQELEKAFKTIYDDIEHTLPDGMDLNPVYLKFEIQEIYYINGESEHFAGLIKLQDLDQVSDPEDAEGY